MQKKMRNINQIIKSGDNKYKLNNMIIDICYKNNSSKQFAWDICGDVILENLFKRNNYKYL